MVGVEAMFQAFVDDDGLRPLARINTHHFDRHRALEGLGAEIKQLSQTLLLEIRFVVLLQLSSQRFNLMTQLQIFLMDLRQLNITLPKIVKALCSLSQSCLQRHEARQDQRFKSAGLRRKMRFYGGERQGQGNQREEKRETFPAI